MKKAILCFAHKDEYLLNTLIEQCLYNSNGETDFYIHLDKKCLDYLLTLQPNPRRGELEMGDWIQTIASENGNAKVFELADAYVNINYAKDIEMANQMLSV